MIMQHLIQKHTVPLRNRRMKMMATKLTKVFSRVGISHEIFVRSRVTFSVFFIQTFIRGLRHSGNLYLPLSLTDRRSYRTIKPDVGNML